MSSTVKTTDITEAEEMVIALAGTHDGHQLAASTSELSIGLFPSTLTLLLHTTPNLKIKLVWTAAHAFMKGNKFAHQ